ncbi:MAG: hypothetical protein JOZ78_26035 [Chroococcidiopsidaceae cyanobacterium CP_BM_ER_R8_30]|nr:hypothetical protein [Chroococcidiopsidaceae cyanobacterium CP_BM_ER_R8_30]
MTSQATKLTSSNQAQPVDARKGAEGIARTAPDDSRAPAQVKPAEPSLWGEIMKVWEWLVFIWRMLPRIGGFGALVRTLFLIISLLTTRLLVQWGILKNKDT